MDALDFKEQAKNALKGLIDGLTESIIVVEKGESQRRGWQFFPKTPHIAPVKVEFSALKLLFSNWESVATIIPVDKFVFNPLKPTGLLFLGTQTVFNNYIQPSWKADYVPGKRSVPQLFDLFLNHLTANNERSKFYILSWAAWSLYPEAYIPYLTFLGNEGVGKGLLGDILEMIHSPHSSRVRDLVIKKEFNRQLENKSFVHIDELKLRNDEDMNRLKDLINRRIEIEGKGRDSYTTDNWAKIMISSNNLNALDLSDSQRRFSIADITNIPTKDSDLVKNNFGGNHGAFVRALLHPDHIKAIGQYLYSLGSTWADEDHLAPYKPSNYKELQAMCQGGWVDWFIDDWIPEQVCRLRAKNKVIDNQCRVALKVFQQDFRAKYPTYEPPGRAKISEICQKYSNRIHLMKHSSGDRAIVIYLDKDEQDLFTGDIT